MTDIKQGKKPPFWRQLFVTFIRSAILTYSRILIIGWYVYFALVLYVPSPGYLALLFYILMFGLSVFGLWQVLEWLWKKLKLIEDDPPPA